MFLAACNPHMFINRSYWADQVRPVSFIGLSNNMINKTVSMSIILKKCLLLYKFMLVEKERNISETINQFDDARSLSIYMRINERVTTHGSFAAIPGHALCY